MDLIQCTQLAATMVGVYGMGKSLISDTLMGNPMMGTGAIQAVLGGPNGRRTEPADESLVVGVAGAEADDHDRETLEVVERHARANERLEVLCVADVARVHDGEAVDEAVLVCPAVRAVDGRDRSGVGPVRDDAKAL